MTNGGIGEWHGEFPIAWSNEIPLVKRHTNKQSGIRDVLFNVLEMLGCWWIPMERYKRKKRPKAAYSVASRRSVGLSGSKYGAADGIITHPLTA